MLKDWYKNMDMNLSETMLSVNVIVAYPKNKNSH